MAIKNYLKQKIARKILIAILLFSFIVTSLSTIIILYSQYSREVAEIEADTHVLLNSQLQTFVQSVWAVDKPLAEILLSSYTNHREMTYAVVLDEDDSIFMASGKPGMPHTKVIKKRLVYQVKPEDPLLTIGTLVVHISTERALKHAKQNLLNIVLTQTLKTFFLSAFFLLILHFFLTRHLQTILKFIDRHIAYHDSNKLLNLERNYKNDELQILVDSINRSKQQLDSNYKILREQKKQLIYQINQRSQAEKEAKTSQNQLRHVLNALTDSVFACTNEGEILFMNYSATRLLGFESHQTMTHTLYMDKLLHLNFSPDCAQPNIQLCRVTDSKESIYKLNAFKFSKTEPNLPTPVDITVIPAMLNDEDEQQRGFIAVIRDETDKFKLEEMSYNATHDFLTGLRNRFYFMRKLEKIIKTERLDNYCLGIFDLDKFKPVNDTYGHQAGDKLLQLVASTFTSKLDEYDLLARLGGDEFIVLFYSPLDESYRKASLMLSALECINFTPREEVVSISCSIGIAPFEHGDTSESIQIKADEACYKAKSKGGGVVQINTEYRLNSI